MQSRFLSHLSSLRLALLVMVGVIIVAPALRAQSGLLAQFEDQTTTFTLDNGMTFIVVERHDAPVASFFTYADVGSVDEPSGQTGVAHMFEHMAFKGTRTIGSRDIEAELAMLEREEEAYLALRAAHLDGAPQATVDSLKAQFAALQDSAKALVEESAFDQLLSRNGAVGMNAFTSADQTGYFYSLPSNKAELWFATESDRFANPVLREFYQERDVVMEERRLRTDSNPIGRLIEEFVTTAYKAHPYGQPTVGHMADLETLSRTEAELFFKRYYTPNNLTVAIVGDVDPQQMRALAERYFAPLPAGERTLPIRTTEPEQLGERRVTIVDQAQPVVIVGYHRPSGSSPEAPAFTVLADLLNRGRTSRFHKALVESELALGANVLNPFPGEKYPGLFAVLAIPAQGKSPDEVEQAISEVLGEVVEEGVTAEELERAKTRARADLVGSLQSNTGLAIELASYEVLSGDWRELFRELEAIEAVTAADVQRVAEETFLTENRTVAVLRNAQQAEQQRADTSN